MKISDRFGPGRTQAGFTLVEVMVAAFLLLLVLIPMSSMLMSSVSAAIKSETENTAALLAQEQIEEIRARNYETMVLNDSQINASQSGLLGSSKNYTFDYEGTTYPVVSADVSGADGAITPVSSDVQRRNATYTIKRYILWVDDPAGGSTIKDYKKIVVIVSWAKPQPGSMTFEADAVKLGTSTSRPPVVVATFPYIGDAFHSWEEILVATATATDPDGTVSNVQFQYKKNIDATFNDVGSSAAPTTTGGNDFSVPWTSNLTAEAQYNLRAIATNNQGLTGVDTHPFFIDTTPPSPPSSIAVTEADGAPLATSGASLWPLRVTWPEVHDYIDGNTNFNMVIGYLVYRDVRTVDTSGAVVAGSEVTGSPPIASIYGSEQTVFYDATEIPDPTSPGSQVEVRYRLKSLGRAQYWRGDGLSALGETASGWVPVALPASPPHFSTFEGEVLATATSWSAVALEWLPQSGPGPRANLYLIYRTPGWIAADVLPSLVGTVYDDGTLSKITYTDENLTRNTSYTYEVVPVVTSEYPTTAARGISNVVTTSVN